MKLFTVHEPAAGGRSPAAAEAIVFVKEGISWPALFFPLLWQVWHGLWLVLIGYLAIAAAVEYGARLLGGSGFAAAATSLFALLFALEANNLRRWSLGRRGYRTTSVVSGRNLEEAEFRFFSHWQEGAPRSVPVSSATAPQPQAPRPIPQQPAGRPAPIGVFPQPGGRS